jgi:hypothetical protein
MSDKISAEDFEILRNTSTRPGPGAGKAIDKSKPPFEPGAQNERVAELTDKLAAIQIKSPLYHEDLDAAVDISAELSRLRNEQPKGGDGRVCHSDDPHCQWPDCKDKCRPAPSPATSPEPQDVRDSFFLPLAENILTRLAATHEVKDHCATAWNLSDQKQWLAGELDKAFTSARHALAQQAPDAAQPVRVERLPDLTFWYRNYRGEVSQRRVVIRNLRWASNEYHKEPQWLLFAYDMDKEAEREFTVRDMAPTEQALYTAPPRPDAVREALEALTEIRELEKEYSDETWPTGLGTYSAWCKATKLIAAALSTPAPSANAEIERLPCGHHKSLEIVSVESDYRACELCEARSMKRDAETMEVHYKEQRDAANAEIKRLTKERDEARAQTTLWTEYAAQAATAESALTKANVRIAELEASERPAPSAGLIEAAEWHEHEAKIALEGVMIHFGNRSLSMKEYHQERATQLRTRAADRSAPSADGSGAEEWCDVLKLLVPAVKAHVDEHGACGYLLARLSDAERLLKRIGVTP